MDKTCNKKKIIISFIGKGDYKEVEYQLNGRRIKSRLAIIPIKELFGPEEIYVIGTEESKWSELNGIDYKKVIIPAGNSEKEFWQMMDILSENIKLTNSDVAFDITHCFRTIPFFVVIYIKFMKFIEPTAEIKHIYYANLDNKSILDLKPLLDMLDWVDAASIFKQNGDLEHLSILVTKNLREAFMGEKQTSASSLKKLNKIMKELSAITKMTYVPQLGEISNSFSELLADAEFKSETKRYLKPLYYLLPKVEEMIEKFKASTEWESQLKIASWYLDNNRPSQALIVLREAIITHQCLKGGMDPYDSDVRREIEETLNKAVKTKSEMPIYQLWDKVSQHRNKVAHALMRRRENINPEKAIRTTAEYLKEASKILPERSEDEN
ncbi:MAG: hypothetical protein C0168_10305 [Candidatus Aminicenantes bacterium]|nr:MAG: hypothetical protein C0168_10305 [Candidatus Aminicenantes bacterium]